MASLLETQFRIFNHAASASGNSVYGPATSTAAKTAQVDDNDNDNDVDAAGPVPETSLQSNSGGGQLFPPTPTPMLHSGASPKSSATAYQNIISVLKASEGTCMYVCMYV